MKKIIFIADLFLEQIVGGGELNNEEIIKKLRFFNYEVIKINSNLVTEQFVTNNKDSFFIIGNFIGLNKNIINLLLKTQYIIYEHDHKYLINRNPTNYKNFISDEKNIINKEFYQNAIAVFCQSKLHSEVVWKNLNLKNIINCSGNLWSDEQIKILEKYKDQEKTFDCAILDSRNQIKNTNESIKYCIDNKLSYNIIKFTNFENYIVELSKCRKLVFFPKVLETLSRNSVEAKVVGCKIITNNFLGAASEEWLKQSPENVLNYVKNNNEVIIQKILDCVNGNAKKHYCKFNNLSKISIITSIFKGEKYIYNFLNTITKQTIFDDCELILINAHSPENEESIIKPFLEKFSNIKYIKLDSDPGIYGCWNIGVQKSTGEFICNSNLDDVRYLDNLEILRKHLFFNDDIDLVYGDSCEVNELPSLEKNTSNKLSEHSIYNFSHENMIKCLPGSLPLWRKKLHDKYGYFNEKYKFAGDWEMWLRSVAKGSTFKKIDIISGLYYNNPNGKTTNNNFAKEKFLEEKEIFFKYKNLFGMNYDKFLNWFNRNP